MKVDLHTHTAEDPCDHIRHTARELIDRAAALGFGGISVTLHNRYYDPAPDLAYAASRGVVLLPGVERTIARRHVLLINFPPEAAAVRTFEELANLRAAHPRGLVIAPHPFYPIGSAMGADLERYAHLVDAVEVNSVHTRLFDFNARAVEWARRRGKPLVGNTDLHLLEQLGTTYSLVDADAHPDAICEAIRAGRVQVRSQPLGNLQAAWIFARMLVSGAIGKGRRWTGRV